MPELLVEVVKFDYNMFPGYGSVIFAEPALHAVCGESDVGMALSTACWPQCCCYASKVPENTAAAAAVLL